MFFSHLDLQSNPDTASGNGYPDLLDRATFLAAATETWRAGRFPVREQKFRPFLFGRQSPSRRQYRRCPTF